jgi:hypothetical protein
MKFGLSYNTGLLGTDPANLKAIARHADDLGFESFYVPEHVALYPGARVSAAEFPPDLPIADPLECLAFVAACTTTILAEGRDPEVLEYTRWGSIDMEPGDVEASAAQGVDRLVVGTTSTDRSEQLRQLEAFATRHGLRR